MFWIDFHDKNEFQQKQSMYIGNHFKRIANFKNNLIHGIRIEVYETKT